MNQEHKLQKRKKQRNKDKHREKIRQFTKGYRGLKNGEKGLKFGVFCFPFLNRHSF